MERTTPRSLLATPTWPSTWRTRANARKPRVFIAKHGYPHEGLRRGTRLTAICYNNLALNLYNQDNYRDAETMQRREVAITRKVQGEEHPDLATRLRNLAVILNAQAKYAEADPLTRQALAIRRKALGDEHPTTIRTYGDLAHILNRQARYKEAEPIYRRILEHHVKFYRADHPEIVWAYGRVAANLQARTQIRRS